MKVALTTGPTTGFLPPHLGGGPLAGIVMFLLMLLHANGGLVSLPDFNNFLSLMR